MYEKNPKKCHLCGGRIIVTDSTAAYGKRYGDQMFFLCLGCRARVLAEWNEEKQMYEACGMLTTKQIRTIQNRLIKRLDEEIQKDVPAKYHSYLRDIAYNCIAKHLNLPADKCYISYMNMNQLKQVENVFTYYWDEFILEKYKITAIFSEDSKEIKKDMQKIEIIPPKKSYKSLKRKLTKELTEEDKEEIKKQVDYIMKGKDKVLKKKN